MNFSKRYKRATKGKTPDNLGGYIPEITQTGEYIPCRAVKTTKEWIIKEYSIELTEPLIMYTLDSLEIDDYIYYKEDYYTVRIRTKVNKRTTAAVLEKVIL